MTVRIAGGLLAVALVIALWLSAGITGLLYSLLFVAAAAPGVPAGIAIFGRQHPGGWIGGALIGYGVTQLALSAGIAVGLSSPFGFIGIGLIVLALSIATLRILTDLPLIRSRPWTANDVRALLVVVLLAPALMGITYRNVGRQDAEGNRYYRAYFTADFLWHTALANELTKFTLPPRNPYLSPRPMNYYWTYFLLPSVTARFTSSAPSMPPSAAEGNPIGRHVQSYLKTNSVLVSLLMIGALFVLVRSGTNSNPAAVAAVCLAVLAPSAEGFYAIVDLLRRGRSLQGLLELNIDAVTAWPPFNGLRIDDIPRSLWYTPQHTTSVALGLVGITIGLLAGATARPAAIAGAGLALGLSTTMNPFLGGVCSVIYAVCVVVDAIRRPGAVLLLARHALAALFVIAAIAWGAMSRMTEGAGSALTIGFGGLARNSPISTLILSLGPVLLPAAFGARRLRSEIEQRAVTVGAAGVLLGLILLYFVRISDAAWVGFRAGQILLVSIPLLLARTIERLPRTASAVMVILILILGLPTTLIDTYNAQDITNRRPGPGFHWTQWTTPSQEEAFAWIAANTRDQDIVQMEPVVRGREHWTVIPSFAARRMAAGDPISLLPIPEYKERSQQVRSLFATTNVTEAVTIALRLHLDYLYVDDEDLSAYPEGTRKFDENPQNFERVFANAEVRIYKIR
jgi:hypothetical protein